VSRPDPTRCSALSARALKDRCSERVPERPLQQQCPEQLEAAFLDVDSWLRREGLKTERLSVRPQETRPSSPGLLSADGAGQLTPRPRDVLVVLAQLRECLKQERQMDGWIEIYSDLHEPNLQFVQT